MRAPVLLMTYRKQAFLEDIRVALERYAPPRLYISGNYPAHDNEMATVQAVRDTLRAWRLPCEVEYLFHDRYRVINDAFLTALDHVLARESSVIVLEDDTVPSASFFSFCNHMLARYRDSAEVGSIVGCNLGAADEDGVAFLAPFNMFYWGWATWADTWHRHRRTTLPWGQPEPVLDTLYRRDSLIGSFMQRLDARATWDVQWGWSQALHGLRTVLPGKNLVTNKGFVAEGSYIRFTESAFSHLPCHDMNTEALKPVMHPEYGARYEQHTAAMLAEILQDRGELEYYAGLSD
ncbi:MAG: hypothetical protein C0462_12265 [Alcanivorax sp.]|nr:hypothetical protein [Alcanivorax sp.]